MYGVPTYLHSDTTATACPFPPSFRVSSIRSFFFPFPFLLFPYSPTYICTYTPHIISVSNPPPSPLSLPLCTVTTHNNNNKHSYIRLTFTHPNTTPPIGSLAIFPSVVNLQQQQSQFQDQRWGLKRAIVPLHLPFLLSFPNESSINSLPSCLPACLPM